ncbi:hypothetical protein EDB86DRAFT_2965318 [Lactarius hatsudake]|nr:hypothetical protein EDB86DRAFT_2965318 [Lactarius hatsudake]
MEVFSPQIDHVAPAKLLRKTLWTEVPSQCLRAWLPYSLVGPRIWMWDRRALSPDSISARMTKQHCAQPSHAIGSATPLRRWQSYAGMRILALLVSASRVSTGLVSWVMVALATVRPLASKPVPRSRKRWTSGTRLRSHSPPLDLSLAGYLPTSPRYSPTSTSKVFLFFCFISFLALTEPYRRCRRPATLAYASHLHPSPHASPPSTTIPLCKSPTAMHKIHHDTIAVVTPPKHGVQVAAGPHRR